MKGHGSTHTQKTNPEIHIVNWKIPEEVKSDWVLKDVSVYKERIVCKERRMQERYGGEAR